MEQLESIFPAHPIPHPFPPLCNKTLLHAKHKKFHDINFNGVVRYIGYCSIGKDMPKWDTIENDFIYCNNCFSIIMECTPEIGNFFQ